MSNELNSSRMEKVQVNGIDEIGRDFNLVASPGDY